MGAASLWERGSVPRRQVPTLQEAFMCCDHELLVRAVLEEHACAGLERGGRTPPRLRAMARRAHGALEELCGLDVRRRDGRGRWLLPAESYAPAARCGLIECRMGVRLLWEEDVACAQRLLAGGEGALPVRSLADEPWEAALAFRVWLGGAENAFARHRALAAAFWELTYYGFTREQAAAARAAHAAARPPTEAAGESHAAEGSHVEAGEPCVAAERGPHAAAGEPHAAERSLAEAAGPRAAATGRRAGGQMGGWATGAEAEADSVAVASAATAEELWEGRAFDMGLCVPSPFEAGQRAALDARIAELRHASELELSRRFVEALCSTGCMTSGGVRHGAGIETRGKQGAYTHETNG